MISASIGWEDEVTRYRRFEKDELKAQRIRLHNPPTKSALAAPRRYFKRMPRIEGIRRTFTTENDKALTELKEDFYNNFMPGEALEQWQNRILEFYGVNDPNAWIIAERNDRRNIEGGIIKTKVYPFIVPCEDVLNFQKSFGTLDWLLVRTSEMERVTTENTRRDKILENFYLYAPGYVIRAREKGEKTKIETGEKEVAIPDYVTGGELVNPALPGGSIEFKYPEVKTRKFFIKTIQNGTTEVPGDCVGVYPDETTSMQSFVTWFDGAIEDFKDLIRYKSTADVLLATHAYPQTWEFAPGCRDRSTDYGECDGGYYSGIRDLEHKCTNCKGTGIPANFTTEQEKVILILPEEGQKEIIELAKLSHTNEIKIDFLGWLDGKIESTTAKIMNTLFGAGLFQKPTNTVTKTATEVNELTAGISDVLAPFGAVESRFFELFFRVGAQYRGFELTVDKSYPDDLEIETLIEMVMGYDMIKKAGVGYEATAAQRNRIFQKQFEGSPDVQKAIAAKYKFKPFDDKSDEQVAMIIAGLSPTDPTRVLWAYWLQIFQDIEDENEGFYKMAYKMQKEVVAKKVAEVTALIQQPEIDSVNVPNFIGDEDANPGSTDEGQN